MKTETETKERLWTRLKKSIFAGLLASVIVTVFMLECLSDSHFRHTGIMIVGAAAVIFLMKLLYDILLEKMDIEKKFLANALFLLFALLIFSGISICMLSSAILFLSVHDKAAEQSLEAYRDTLVEPLCVETADGTMTGWLLHSAPDKSPVVLYFGGNGEDASYRIKQLMENSDALAAFAGCKIACLDYPGYGSSDGRPSENSLKRCGLAAYDSLTGRRDVTGVVVMGYSIGTGVANYVASQRQPLGMILLAPYAEGSDLYNGYLNIFYGPLKGLVRFQMKSIKFAEDVKLKPLIMASSTDEIISYKSAKRLFSKYEKGCNFVTLDGVGHNDFWETQEVLAEITKYLDSVK